jgi:hypothetical protein
MELVKIHIVELKFGIPDAPLRSPVRGVKLYFAPCRVQPLRRSVTYPSAAELTLATVTFAEFFWPGAEIISDGGFTVSWNGCLLSIDALVAVYSRSEPQLFE